MSIPDSDSGFCVGTLRIRAPASSDAGALRRDLDAQVWPSVPDGSWVLLRGLDVQGHRGAIARRAAAGVDGLIRGAVEGTGPGARSAAAVRFRDLGELLAALCTDLAAGRAAALWYWRFWSALFGLPPGDAIASLLDRHPEHLTTLTERLEARGSLGLVWGALSDGQARMLQGRLGAWLGRELPAPLTDDREPTAPDWEPPPALLVRRWEGALAGLRREDGRRSLAACLVALEWRPVLLDPGSARWLAAVSLALAGEDRFGPSSARPDRQHGPPASPLFPDSAPASGRGGATGRPEESREKVRHGGPEHRVHPFMPGLKQDAVVDARTGRSLPPAAASAREGLERGFAPLVRTHDQAIRWSSKPGEEDVESSAPIGEKPAGSAMPPPVRSSAPHVYRSGSDGDLESVTSSGTNPQEPATTPWKPGQKPLETDQGGLFYLVNFLSRPEAQALIAANEGFARVPDGWHWLWDLGRRQGLLETGPLASFLAERLGLGDVAELADLPAVPGAADLMDLGQRLYPADDLWGPGLLLVPARIHHSASHLELDFPLRAVRLGVRLVGLDLDPGWVPWLGRVVHFRYLDNWDDTVPAGRR